eukprot:12475350-Heterocapsa_arctica.AAC.1
MEIGGFQERMDRSLARCEENTDNRRRKGRNIGRSSHPSVEWQDNHEIDIGFGSQINWSQHWMG